MRNPVHIMALLLLTRFADGAELALPSECPAKGNMETVQNPSDWADQCFKAINGRLPESQTLAETASSNRDVDLDGVPERLEIRGTGNKLKQIYVFRVSSADFRYMGMLTAHPEFFVARDAENNLMILNIYRAGVDDIFLQRIHYVDGEFVVLREDRME